MGLIHTNGFLHERGMCHLNQGYGNEFEKEVVTRGVGVGVGEPCLPRLQAELKTDLQIVLCLLLQRPYSQPTGSHSPGHSDLASLQISLQILTWPLYLLTFIKRQFIITHISPKPGNPPG